MRDILVKKFTRVASAFFLSFQAFILTPLNVLAEEKPKEQTTEQVQSSTETSDHQEMTESSSVSSSESSTQPTESSSEESRESSSVSSSSSKTEESATSSSKEQPKKPAPEKPKPSEPSKQEPVQEAAAVVETPNENKPAASEENTQTLDLVDQSSEIVPGVTVEDGSLHFEKDESVKSFINKLGEPARKIGQEKDLYASVMIAQAILESGSGSSSLSKAPNFNLFGIKGTHNGKSVSMATQEDLGNGTLYTTQSGFRMYENYEDCFNDYVKLLTEGISGNSDFYSGVLKTNAKTYKEATKFLTGRYATDTQYNKKLNGLIETYDLTQYDKEIQGPPISKKGYKIPVNNYTISSPFGPRGGEFHRGLDLAAAQGEPIHATKVGTVIKAEYHYSWGNYVAIQHEDGSTALYAHQQQYSVKVGEKVVQGQTIGYVGSTGNSTGSHLHLEICRDSSLSQNQLVNPQPLLFDK